MRVAVAAIVAALHLVAAAAAHADANEVAAQVHLDRGVAAFRAGDYPRAHQELSAAHDLAPDKPNPYRWLALTEVQLGDCRSAVEHIDGFVARVPAGDARIAEMQRWRGLCQRTGALAITSTPSAAALRIDGAIVGETPYHSLSMRAGSHTLVADLSGYRTATRTVELAPNGSLSVELALTRRSRPLTQRWWFWVAVGGAAITIAGIAVLASRDEVRTLPPIGCDRSGCNPGGP